MIIGMTAINQERGTVASRLFYCQTCGIVQTCDEPPICRHLVIDGPPVARMIPLPAWHPFAKELI
jgi:hypothetical protein